MGSTRTWLLASLALASLVPCACGGGSALDAGSDGPMPADAAPRDATPDQTKPDAARPDQPGKPDSPAVPPFQPTADTHLAAGNHLFSLVDIAAGITVTVDGEAVIESTGPLSIAGSMVADCTRLDLRASGDIAILGTVRNACPAGSNSAADLVVQGKGGELTLGTPTTPAKLQTSGDLDVTSDVGLQRWEFDVPPGQRSATKLAPVCSARADTQVGMVGSQTPFPVFLSGQGADPNGGEVRYAWDFGDGASSTEKSPRHSYGAAGVFPVVLAVTDGDGDTCRASLQIVMLGSDPNQPLQQLAPPAVAAEPALIVGDVGESIKFVSAALDAAGDELTYAWIFGDGGTSSERHPAHAFASPGRYQVSLVVTTGDGRTAEATSAVYVAAPLPRSLPLAPRPGDCDNPGKNAFNVDTTTESSEPAKPGVDGRSRNLRRRGDAHVYGGTYIGGQQAAEEPLPDLPGTGLVLGQNGGKGGDVELLVEGRLVFCGPGILAAGDGGPGQGAVCEGGTGCYAKGGNGGQGGSLTIKANAISADPSIPPLHPTEYIGLRAGAGGRAGSASASAKEGEAGCPLGEPGGWAKAVGGTGGDGGKLAFSGKWDITLATQVQVYGGFGGRGGEATAKGGSGGQATLCAGIAKGGAGLGATARGGTGGSAVLPEILQALAEAPHFAGGTGGAASATGGAGGAASAFGLACGKAEATGGSAFGAVATGGDGAPGVSADGDGGDGTATGSSGGSAAAAGGDCDSCSVVAGAATATGGIAAGGATDYEDGAFANGGAAGGPGGSKGVASATPGKGGDAQATGGNGGDCKTCPAGRGGDGGAATATGAKGGKANAGGNESGGDGGKGKATGGAGGKGATCCPPDCDPMNEGGHGGNGGTAMATTGLPGGPGGAQPAAEGTGGEGGKGGDGVPKGEGGLGGAGAGNPNKIPDGQPGANGKRCAGFKCGKRITVPVPMTCPETGHKWTASADVSYEVFLLTTDGGVVNAGANAEITVSNPPGHAGYPTEAWLIMDHGGNLPRFSEGGSSLTGQVSASITEPSGDVVFYPATGSVTHGASDLHLVVIAILSLDNTGARAAVSGDKTIMLHEGEAVGTADVGLPPLDPNCLLLNE